MGISIRSLLVGVVLVVIYGCDSGSDYDFAANTPPPVNLQPTSEAIFDPATGALPSANNLLFAGSTDGTLNIPFDPADPAAPLFETLNALDGFSTVAPVTTEFGTTLDASTLTVGQNLRVFEVTADPATGAVTGVSSELTAVDIAAVAVGTNQTTLALLPLSPLKELTTYLVVLTDGILDSAGTAMQSSLVYDLTKLTQPFTNPDLAELEPVRQLVNSYEAAAATQGINTGNIILSWAFTTQSITAVLNATAAQVSAGAISVSITNNSSPGNAAHIYTGSLTLPYYLEAPTLSNPTSPLTGFWKSSNGTSVTVFDPLPVSTGDRTIPVLMTVPKGNTPADGWPVVIFQHGITSNRTALLGIADVLANAGFAAVAIDLPLHGITDTADPLKTTFERTFDSDFVNNTTGAAGPDNVIDSSGFHYINLQSLLTSRDNVRQGAIDLLVLRDSLVSVTPPGSGVELDESDVNFVGHSLGGMVGTTYLALEDQVAAATLAMPGGGIARLLDGSATFGPIIQAGLAANGILAGTPEFDAFMVVAQTAVDSADPVNHAATVAAAGLPVHMIEVVGGNTSLPDQTIPNTVPGAPLSGTEPLATQFGLSPLSTGNSATGGLVRFTVGDHGSILSPAASPEATTEMQAQMVEFMTTDGASLTITDTSVVLQ